MKLIKHYRFLLIVISLFVFSCQDKYNNESVRIDLHKTHQEIDGFGSCIVGYKEYPEEFLTSEFYNKVVNDLGMSIVRFPLNEQLEWKNDDDDPGNFNWNNFYLENIHRRPGLNQNVGQIMTKFKEYGVERFMGTPWSAPQFMKTNRAPIQGGFLRADMPEELAEYLSASIILAKKNYDIDINWVSINNESIFVEFYRSCLYNGQMMREAVRAADKKFKELGINSKILINEDMMFHNRFYYGLKPTMEDPETKDFQGHFAVHAKDGPEGLEKWKELSKDWNKKLWMTETSGHEPTFKGAFAMATIMHNYLVHGNISAWIYWQISGDTGSGNGSRYTLMDAGKPTIKYYAAKHFYKYIRPGANRVDVVSDNPDLLVSAYKHNSDGTITIVVINKGEETANEGIYINGKKLPKSYQQYRTSETENCKLVGTIEGLTSVEFPPMSITTLYGESSGLKKANPIKVKEAWVVPQEDENKSWGNPDELPFKTEWQRKADGDANLIEEAKKEGVNKTRANGWSILHDAVLNGDGETIDFLLKNGADINKPANDGWTPLHAAAATFVGNRHKQNKTKDYSKYGVFKLVLEANPDIHAKTNDGWTALHSAVANAYTGYRSHESGALNKIIDLVNAGVEVEAKDKNGRTALHWAAWQGYNHFIGGNLQVEADAVDLLIKFGADVNAVDNLGNTPLHYASKMGYEEIVYSLVKAGAKKDVINKEGNKPIDFARERELANTIYILENDDYPDELKAYIESKTESNKESKLGKELLQAAWSGNIEEVKQLISQGADLEYRDTDGLDAMDRAIANGHSEIVKILKETKEKRTH